MCMWAGEERKWWNEKESVCVYVRERKSERGRVRGREGGREGERDGGKEGGRRD